jgi:DNA-binding MarR family transcriptional regulator
MTLASGGITSRRKPALPPVHGHGQPPGPLPPRAPAEAAFGSFIMTLGLLKRVMEPHFASFGLSSAQWGVLHTLHRCAARGDAAPRLTDLGDCLIVRPASITGVVDRLQRMGLVARTASASDHRAKNVSLTDAGCELVARVLEHHPAQVRRVMQGLTASEQSELNRLLEKMSSHLERLTA